MKKTWQRIALIATAVLGVLAFPAGVQAKKVTVESSVTEYYWDTTQNQWVLSNQYEYEYNKKGLMSKEVSRYNELVWDEVTETEKWVPHTDIYTYKYRKDGQMSSSTCSRDGVKSKTTYKYNKKGLEISGVEKRGKKVFWKEKFTYNKKGDITKAVYEDYSEGTKIKNTEKYKYTYKKGVLRKVVTTATNFTTTDTYDKKGRIKKSFTVEDDGSTSETLYYTNGNPKKDTRKLEGYTHVTNYDKKGNETEMISTGTDGSVSKTKYVYKKNKAGKILEKTEICDGVTLFKTVYTYTKVKG